MAVAVGIAAQYGCSHIPAGRYAVSAVGFRGAHEIDSDDLESSIATRPSSKFFGLWSGVVFDYELYDPFVLERDLMRVERFYRSHGFYDAHARAGRVEPGSGHKVSVTIVVEEGKPVLVQKVTVRGIDALTPKHQSTVRSVLEKLIKLGRRFEESVFEDAEKAVQKQLTTIGYARATVTRSAEVEIAEHVADVMFDVTAGPPCVVGPISINGLGPLPEGHVRLALNLKEGAPYSSENIQSAQQAVLNLGVFSSVVIEPDLTAPDAPGHAIPIHVKLEESKLRNVSLGGGIEFDNLRTDLHVTGGWQNRNFLGGMRKFEVQLRPGVVLYPINISQFRGPIHPLPEGTFKASLEQPGFLQTRLNGSIRTEASVYPVLFPTSENDAPIPNVVGYTDLRESIGIDRTFGAFFASLSYNVQTSFPFVYLGSGTNGLSDIVVTYPSLMGRFDKRDDRIHPKSGYYLQAEVQVGTAPGRATDVRIQPEARGYIRLSKGVVLALRGTLGMLFPFNYDATISNVQPSTLDIQLNFFRAFFSGGPNSNRGYPFRQIGPTGSTPFYFSPFQSANSGINCNSDPTNTSCQLPIGGLSLWEASTEVRFTIGGPVSAVVFCDASDVASHILQFRILHPHLSCGAGARYDTPVGPIRLDIGYRIPGAQGPTSDPSMINKPSEVFGVLPIGFAFGVGEAF